MGPDKKRLLRRLPDHFEKVLPPNEAAQTKHLWNVGVISSAFTHLILRSF